MLLIGILAATAIATEFVQCTDMGGLVGTRDATGVITAHIAGRFQVTGTLDAITVADAYGGVRYAGPLEGLHPVDPPDSAWGEKEARVAEVFRVAETDLRCGPGGRRFVHVGRWPEPLPLPDGVRVVFANAHEVLVRSENGGVGWLLATGGDALLAADIATDMHRAFGDAAQVVYADGRLLISVQRGTGMTLDAPEVQPETSSTLPWATLLRPPRSLASTVRLPAVDPPAVGAAMEMVSRINGIRHGSGLPALVLHPRWIWSALGHCAYVDWAQANRYVPTHFQDPASPAFTGADPRERGGFGTREALALDPLFLPQDAVDAWLQAPFHRAALLRSELYVAGACATSNGARVLNIADAPTAGLSPHADLPEAVAYPPDDAVDVPLEFDGLEHPDPLPLEQYPDRVYPVGFPISVFFAARPETLSKVRSTLQENGVDVPFQILHWGNSDALRMVSRGEVHLVPLSPLKHNTDYTWTISYRHMPEELTPREQRKRLEQPPSRLTGRFTTRGVILPAMSAPDEALPILATVNEARTQPVTWDTLAAAAAELYAAGNVHAFRRVLPVGAAGVSCTSAQRLVQVESLGQVISASGSRIGVSRFDRDRVCALVMDTPRSVPAWAP
jgi:uncharacterized protein YkwD